MPILVKDYKWSETEKEVYITIPLKGVKSSKADIFTTSEYIKVHYPPFLFEVQLYSNIIEEQCNVKIGEGLIEFRLVKSEETLWGKLASEGDKEMLASKREEAITISHQRAKQEKQEKAKRKREEEQFAIKEQMRLEQEDKERVEKEKQAERDKSMKELEQWKDKQTTNKQIKVTSKQNKSHPQHNMDIWTKKTEQVPPPPRKGGNISVRFTPRPFSTAARESKIPEEEEWLTKMAAARKITLPENSDESVNERNPEFLKDKGIDFFKNGNYEAAINVFSEAIQLNGNLPSLYSNRAACYLKMGNNDKCIVDCCRALELYYPVVPSNYVSRTKVFVRRGTAYANNGFIELALQDYDAALKLSPNNEMIKHDYEKLKLSTITTL